MLEQLCIAALRYVVVPSDRFNIRHAQRIGSRAIDFLLQFSITLQVLQEVMDVCLASDDDEDEESEESEEEKKSRGSLDEEEEEVTEGMPSGSTWTSISPPPPLADAAAASTITHAFPSSDTLPRHGGSEGQEKADGHSMDAHADEENALRFPSFLLTPSHGHAVEECENEEKHPPSRKTHIPRTQKKEKRKRKTQEEKEMQKEQRWRVCERKAVDSAFNVKVSQWASRRHRTGGFNLRHMVLGMRAFANRRFEGLVFSLQRAVEREPALGKVESAEGLQKLLGSFYGYL